jgi:hypothetical protein
MDRK